MKAFPPNFSRALFSRSRGSSYAFLFLALGLLVPLASAASLDAAARVTINSNSGSLSSSSTNSSDSFKIENESRGGIRIHSVEIDLSTAVLPDVVFDPAGTAGDPDGKAFVVDSFTGSGTPSHSFESPHDGVGSEDGYDVLLIRFGPGVDFAPGDRMTFSADVDPTSVKGAAGPGPEHSASISGLELIGATIRVVFSDGSVRLARTGGVPGTSANKASMAVLSADQLETPVISVSGRSSPFTISQQPVVRVNGPAGAKVSFWKLPAALYLAGVPGGGYDIDPYEVNKVIGFGYDPYTLGPGGFVDVPVSMTRTTVGGIYLLSAFLVDDAGRRSSLSNVLVVDYNPSASVSDTQAPTAPLNPVASEVTPNSVLLAWGASTDNVGVSRYVIQRNGVQVFSGSALSFRDAGLSASTVYVYRITAFDAAGNSSVAAVIEVTTSDPFPDLEAPSRPEDLICVAVDGDATLTWNASTDNVGVNGYRILRDGVEIARVTSTTHIDRNLLAGRVFEYEVAAFDAAGNMSMGALVQVVVPDAGTGGQTTLPLRVNVGSGTDWVDPQGQLWRAGFGFGAASSAKSYSNLITGSIRPSLYQTRRTVSSSQPSLAYGFSLPSGSYQVTLHFVEVVSALFQPDARVFGITAEGQSVLDALDIFSRVGGNAACTVTFPVTVVDGHLDLGFPRMVNNPTLSGIEVLPAPPPSFEEWLLIHGLAGSEGEDSDSGGLDNFDEYELRMDPKDASDDAGFRLHCESLPTGGKLLRFPPLKPLGHYHLHCSTDLAGLGRPSCRIATVTRAQIALMSEDERAGWTFIDPNPESRAFYQVVFEASID
ncbi:MAG: hypothetical protein EAZ84_06480 [Verrucomicrobia bacterium]|nr:MAG: hypothetical protein EAZ84_06480 [Verrucomicrobiota bacterium]